MPDVIIANLGMPGLSGKDLLVAFSAQNVETPVIVLAKKGQEANIVQAFRLGAVDYILWPVHEPEVITVVERVLKQVHDRQERTRLARQVQQTNQELQLRVRELTTIFSIGKAVTSITNPSVLQERIVEGAVRVTQADLGWLLLRQENEKTFRLVAQRGLPDSLADLLNQPWDDGISSLVAMSGEPLTIHGDPLKRFKIASLGQAAMIAPVKVQKQVTGLLVVLRRQMIPFGASEQHLLEAVADYASISMVNARLFQAVEDRAQSLEGLAAQAQVGEKINSDILRQVKAAQQPAVETALTALDNLAKDPAARWTAHQRPHLSTLQEQLQHLARVTQAINPSSTPEAALAGKTDLRPLAQAAANRAQHTAMANSLTFSAELPPGEVWVRAPAAQLSALLDAVLSAAFAHAALQGQVTLRLERSEKQAHLVASASGESLSQNDLNRLFSDEAQGASKPAARFGGLGIRLSLAKEIAAQLQGKLWAESKAGQGCQFHLALPVLRSN
jgi:signal transduction histidine kinase